MMKLHIVALEVRMCREYTQDKEFLELQGQDELSITAAAAGFKKTEGVATAETAVSELLSLAV